MEKVLPSVILCSHARVINDRVGVIILTLNKLCHKGSILIIGFDDIANIIII